MKRLLLLACLLLPVLVARADADDRTLSPYFYVKTERPAEANGLDTLPLKSTKIDAIIAGVIAEVRVTQTYANTGTTPLEAIYIFPGSTRAAVHGLTLRVGDRQIEATIKERGEARQVYEQAKSEGRTASLLEQQRPNVFQMNVANILPGDLVKVELRYTELLAPVDGEYRFVSPGVVGPRYSNQPASNTDPTEAFVQNPYLSENSGVEPPAFDLAVHLDGGVPVRDAVCATHSTRIRYTTTTTVDVTLDGTQADAGNRDFILRYRLTGPALQAGLLLAQGDNENTFLAMIQPPARPSSADLPPRDYLFILDVSGSMSGFPLDTAKTLLRDLLTTPRPKDTFNLLLFAGDNRTLSNQSLPASDKNVARAIDFIDRQQGGGGTELLAALHSAFALPRAEGTARTVVILTDGYVSVEAEAYAFIRNNLGQGNVFTFGIGSSVNRELIEGLARAGQGEPFIVTGDNDAVNAANRFAEYIRSPVLTGINVQFEGFDAYDVEPLSVPDVFAARPVILHGKWRGPATGQIVLTGHTGGAPYSTRLSVAEATRIDAPDVLSQLWARTRIARLSDDLAVSNGSRQEDDSPAGKLKAEITSLGLGYNLLTQFTSFVAVDTVIRRDPADALNTVKQPLSLPQGVTNSAVGQNVPVSPEPGTLLLVIVGLAALGLVGWRRRRTVAKTST